MNMKELTLLNFSEVYPDEETCVKPCAASARIIVLHQYWDKAHKSWICSRCGHETTLRSGTVMQGSNLPVRDWFATMFLLTATKRTISAREIQRQLGRKRYQPVWEMVQSSVT